MYKSLNEISRFIREHTHKFYNATVKSICGIYIYFFDYSPKI